MPRIGRVVKLTGALVAAIVLAVAGWLFFAPPELIRVGSAYAAKIVCSNVFVADRDAREVLSNDVQAPGHPLLRIMRVSVNQDTRTVTAGLLGVFGKSTAIARVGLGCVAVPDGDVLQARATDQPASNNQPASTQPWPQGSLATFADNPALEEVLDNPKLTGSGMRALIVVHDGRVVGERYGEGFSTETPLLGWSMTKTVNAAIIGTLVKAGRMDLGASDLLDAWKGDDRARITIADLMAMSSGLAFNEDYGAVADVTRMLFLEPDMAAFAASQPLKGKVGQRFEYSSGTAAILSRLWQDAAGADALGWPRHALFDPLGMASAVFEADESGTFAGSSYLYATARDWARFGQFLLQDGVWDGKEVLPSDFVSWMREPAPASDGIYGKGQLWLRGPGGPSADASLPADTYWLIGHDGQSMAIAPSRRLVVLRLGLTPSKLGYRPQGLVSAVAKTLD